MSQIVTLQFRRGTESGPTGWAAVNTTLSQGEPGLATDTGVLKIGDGQTKWNDLPITSQSYPDVGSPIIIGNSADGNDATISIGGGAGSTGQREYSIAIGLFAGQKNQKSASVALGVYAAQENQGLGSVAVGTGAGQIDQGQQSIAIGAGAGNTNQPDHTIILNASTDNLDGIPGQTGSFYVDPIRNAGASYSLMYNTTTKEVTYSEPQADASQWAGFPAITSVDMGSFEINGASNISTTTVSVAYNGSLRTPAINLYNFDTTPGQIFMQDNTGTPHTLESVSGNLCFDGQTLARSADIQNVSDWAQYPAVQPIDISFQEIKNVSQISGAYGLPVSLRATILIVGGITGLKMEAGEGFFGQSGEVLTSDGEYATWQKLPAGASGWAGFPAISDSDMAGFGISGASFIRTQTISSDGVFGSTGQYLSSDGSKIVWVDLPQGTPGTTISVSPNTILWSPDGTSVTGTTGLQYSSGVGITMDVLKIQGSPYPGTISIGYAAGQGGQGDYAVAIGLNSGQGQGEGSVAIGYAAGYTAQEDFCVAVGNNAGITGQKERAVAVGQSAGNTVQGAYSVAVGDSAGYTGQRDYSVAVGPAAGYTEQGANSVAVGNRAGEINQFQFAVAIGDSAGNTGQKSSSVAIGRSSGNIDQGQNSVAIGRSSGEGNQGQQAVAIGYSSGQLNQGDYSVAIGALAGDAGQAANTIILNASGADLNGVPAQTNSFYVKPIRSITGASTGNIFYAVSYNPVTGELTIP